MLLVSHLTRGAWKQGARDEYPRLTSAYLKPEKKGDVER